MQIRGLQQTTWVQKRPKKFFVGRPTRQGFPGSVGEPPHENTCEHSFRLPNFFADEINVGILM